jgi:phage head maturation protease
MSEHKDTHKDIKKSTASVELKAFTPEVNSDRPFQWEGYASQYGNIDTENDIVMPGAFDAYIGKTVAAYLEHKTVVGKILVKSSDDYGLVVEGKLFDNEVLAGTPEANLNQLMRALYTPDATLQGSTHVDYFMSIGYVPTQVSYKTIDGKRIRLIEKANLIEVSLVRLPANRGAVLTAVKSEAAQAEPVDNTVLHEKYQERISELESKLSFKHTEAASLTALVNIQSQFIKELSAKTLSNI